MWSYCLLDLGMDFLVSNILSMSCNHPIPFSYFRSASVSC